MSAKGRKVIQKLSKRFGQIFVNSWENIERKKSRERKNLRNGYLQEVKQGLKSG
jgi:NMD protein affecting ribosome stability and mRNA decay